MLLQLQRETSRLPPAEVRNIAYAVKAIVDQEGSRYKLRGSGGGKFPLGARVERSRKVLGTNSAGKKILGPASGSATASMSVAGVPAGFWRIVEEGSGRHLITGRRRRNGRRLTTKGAMSGFLKASESGSGFNVGNPIRLKAGSKGPGGWKQWADHPGHGPIGRPWAKSMIKANVVVDRMHQDYVRARLTAAWLR